MAANLPPVIPFLRFPDGRYAIRAATTRCARSVRLPGEVRRQFDPVLEQAGCLRYLA